MEPGALQQGPALQLQLVEHLKAYFYQVRTFQFDVHVFLLFLTPVRVLSCVKCHRMPSTTLGIKAGQAGTWPCPPSS